MAAMPTTALPFTGDPEADRLLVDEPLALLIGFALDQQVTVQKAFSGPAELKRPHRPPRRGEDRRAWTRPSSTRCSGAAGLHRFPGAMAGKVQALCEAIARIRERRRTIWTEAPDGRSLESRLLSLPASAR
jgi:uncharacterized HhH-GPD family protein